MPMVDESPPSALQKKVSLTFTIPALCLEAAECFSQFIAPRELIPSLSGWPRGGERYCYRWQEAFAFIPFLRRRDMSSFNARMRLRGSGRFGFRCREWSGSEKP